MARQKKSFGLIYGVCMVEGLDRDQEREMGSNRPKVITPKVKRSRDLLRSRETGGESNDWPWVIRRGEFVC